MQPTKHPMHAVKSESKKIKIEYWRLDSEDTGTRVTHVSGAKYPTSCYLTCLDNHSSWHMFQPPHFQFFSRIHLRSQLHFHGRRHICRLSTSSRHMVKCWEAINNQWSFGFIYHVPYLQHQCLIKWPWKKLGGTISFMMPKISLLIL